MKLSPSFSGMACAAYYLVVMHAPCAAGTPDPHVMVLPADFLDRISPDPSHISLTLPNGRRLAGTPTTRTVESARVTRLEGGIEHPEDGHLSFTLTRNPDGSTSLSGTLRLTAQPTEWHVEPGNPREFRLVESPAADAFRPSSKATPANRTVPSRDQAEEALRRDLKITRIDDSHWTIGSVEMNPTTREIHFPATLNMREGTVEYALVTTTGKCHEAVFRTTASPRDIHIAMLLLGVKPDPRPLTSNTGNDVPQPAAVTITASWKSGTTITRLPLPDLIRRADTRSEKSAPNPWLYNGSRFDQAGFGAQIDGSIISLIRDDIALINNPAPDRSNDKIHLPNTDLLPPPGTDATITLSAPRASTQIHNTP